MSIKVLPDPAGCYYTVDGKSVDYVYAFGPQVEAATRVARLLGVRPESVEVVKNYKELKGK